MKRLLIFWIFVGILIFVGKVSAQPQGLENAVSAWLFDEGSGNIAVNAIPDKPEGNLVGRPSWGEGLYGTALEFDGIDDGVEIDSNPLIGVHTLTIQAYIMPYSIPDFESSKIFNIALERATEGKDRFMLDILPSGSEGWALSHFMSIEGHQSDAEDEVLASGPVHSFNKWYHVALVFDSLTINAVKIKHYVNHSIEHEWHYTLSRLNEGEVYIGERYQPKGHPPIRNYFHGLMDNVVLHKKALTPEEFMPKPEDISDVDHKPINIPVTFVLHQNYPNPFNPQTIISYQLLKACRISLKVYDLTDRLVRTLVDGFQYSGYQFVEWDARDSLGNKVTSGIYFYSLEAGNFKETKRMVLLR